MFSNVAAHIGKHLKTHLCFFILLQLYSACTAETGHHIFVIVGFVIGQTFLFHSYRRSKFGMANISQFVKDLGIGPQMLW